ncbi:unnamed protein product, partial [Ectocarpus sp. 12 AP-2014]
MSVSAAGAAGARGVEVMSSRNLNLLATVCLLEENESCGGIESGGGDGANHDEKGPIEDVARAATQVTDTQPVVTGFVTVQAAGEAGAGDVMPTSSESAGVAQWPGSSSGGGGSGSDNGGVDEHEEDAIPVPRRSSRVVGSSSLESPSVVRLLAQIRTDDPRVEVLKLHNYIPADVSTPVIDAVLEALMLNNNCQALYIQN